MRGAWMDLGFNIKEEKLKCCFIGHRKIEKSVELNTKLKIVIEDLIVNKNVEAFLFGSKSEFDSLCHSIVCELKNKYTNIRRVSYTCGSESCILERDREAWEKIYFKIYKQQVSLLCFDDEVEHKSKYYAGKAGYIERNKAMINDSDYCVFYYDDNYLPPERKHSKRCVLTYQPNSGTKLAFDYAMKTNKIVINVKNCVN